MAEGWTPAAPKALLVLGSHLTWLLLVEGAVPGSVSLSVLGLGAVHTAHGEAGDVQQVRGCQHTEYGHPYLFHLRVTSSFTGRLVWDLAEPAAEREGSKQLRAPESPPV